MRAGGWKGEPNKPWLLDMPYPRVEVDPSEKPHPKTLCSPPPPRVNLSFLEPEAQAAYQRNFLAAAGDGILGKIDHQIVDRHMRNLGVLRVVTRGLI